MPAISTVGVRSLMLARMYGSTSRILDIAKLNEKYNSSFDEDAKNVSRSDNFGIFKHIFLNKSFIIKHTIREHEKELFESTTYNATKIIFPFISKDLNMGGISVFIGEKNYQTKTNQYMGCGPNDSISYHDEQMLILLSEIPSFDPFLLSERAAYEDIDLPKGIIDISERDLFSMRSSVANDLSKITSLAMSKGVGEATNRLASAFLSRRGDARLEPLRAAMKMSKGDFDEAIFSWKGLIYYQWKLQQSADNFSDIVDTLSKIRMYDSESADRKELRSLSHHIIRTTNYSMIMLSTALASYQNIMESISVRQDAGSLSDFLKNARNIYEDVGYYSSILNHIFDFWSFAMKGVEWKYARKDFIMERLTALCFALPKEHEIDDSYVDLSKREIMF